VVTLGSELRPMHLQLLQVLLLHLEGVLLLGQTLDEFLADRLLMVAEDGHLLIGLIVFLHLFLKG
jgi:hypothetical protein